MIRHALKLIWNRKRANALLLLEIFVSLIVLFAVLSIAVDQALDYRRPLGFDPTDLWTVEVSPDVRSAEVTEQQAELLAVMTRELEALSWVEHVSPFFVSPYRNASFTTRTDLSGTLEHSIEIEVLHGTANLPETLGFEVSEGRWFVPDDHVESEVPVVVTRSLAEELWGTSRDAIGRTFPLSDLLCSNPRPGDIPTRSHRVVGLVDGFRKGGELSNPKHIVFESYRLGDASGIPLGALLVRTAPGTTAHREQELANRLHGLAPGWSFEIALVEARRDSYLRSQLAPLMAIGVVCGFLLIMVALGLTGVLWQNVARRTREIGLRRAQGATGADVHRQILYELWALTFLGLVLGAVVAAQMPLLGDTLGITPTSFALAFAASTAILGLLTTACGLYPAWLATRVQPAVALHED